VDPDAPLAQRMEKKMKKEGMQKGNKSADQ
jgi:hypothetical protein